MNPLFRRALKKQQPSNLALLDATEAEGNILGRIVSLHRTRSMALIDELDFQEGTNPKPRTRVVTLKQKLPVGTLVTPEDIQPMRRQEVNR